jgi:glycogen operon protein
LLHGRHHDRRGLADVSWVAEDGRSKTAAQWQDPARRTLGLMLAGDAGPDAGDDGAPETDATLLLLLNAGDDAVDWVLPTLPGAPPWRVLLHTATDDGTGAAPRAGRIRVEARSLLLLAAG